MNTFPFPLLTRFTLSSFSSALPKTTTSPLFLSPKSASSSSLLATLFACADAMTASSVDARRTTQSMMPPTRNPATSFAGGRANDDTKVVKVSPLPPLLLPRLIRCTPSSRGRIGGRLLVVVVVLPIIFFFFAPRLDDTTLDACGSSSSNNAMRRGQGRGRDVLL